MLDRLKTLFKMWSCKEAVFPGAGVFFCPKGCPLLKGLKVFTWFLRTLHASGVDAFRLSSGFWHGVFNTPAVHVHTGHRREVFCNKATEVVFCLALGTLLNVLKTTCVTCSKLVKQKLEPTCQECQRIDFNQWTESVWQGGEAYNEPSYGSVRFRMVTCRCTFLVACSFVASQAANATLGCFSLPQPATAHDVVSWPVVQMIVEPELRVPDFIKAGADIVSVHAETAATIHLHRTINQVRTTHFKRGYKTGNVV